MEKNQSINVALMMVIFIVQIFFALTEIQHTWDFNSLSFSSNYFVVLSAIFHFHLR